MHDRVAHKLTQHRGLQAELLDHGWREVHMHAFVIGHTGMQPHSNMGCPLDPAGGRRQRPAGSCAYAQRKHLLHLLLTSALL